MKLKDVLSWAADIGMWTINRPIPGGCPHRTDYCDSHCYNNKLYRIYKLEARDQVNEQAWLENDVSGLAEALARKRKRKGSRLRLMSRGEAFSDYADVERVRRICEALPNTIVWVPTKAWRHALLGTMARELVREQPNLRLMASTDPSTTEDEWGWLKAQGWATMFFGDDAATVTPNGDRSFKCPKTYKHLKTHCSICKAGCFGTKRVDVHLKQH